MKRGGPDHPKTKRLAIALNLKRYEVVGLLESLWHFTASYAKRGDIGKWSDEEICAGLGWHGQPEVLIDALVESHFLDRCEQHRLLVHDWQEHADQTVSRSEEVRNLGFASMLLANASQPYPKPEPEPEPNPKPGPKPAPDSARAVFKPPALEEVTAYCRERGDKVDPQQWYDHYTSNGWMVGRSKMKDWRAAVRTWEKNEFRKGLRDERPSPGSKHDPQRPVRPL